MENRMGHRQPKPWLWALITLLSPGLGMAQAQAAENTTQFNVDVLWIVVASALVFVMQFGFLAFEVGCVRRKNMVVTAMKNLGDWLIVSIVFFLVGFAILYGTSAGGFIGTDHFLGLGVAEHSKMGWTFFLFQLTFAGTAATIVSGAMAERTGFKAYLLFTIFMAVIIYPVYGHWVWGTGLHEDNQPWLWALGFRDFAGGSVVHITGASAAFVGIRMVGPRLGRYSSDGKVNEMESESLLWSCLGLLILWFGWFGFNGGSALAVNADIGLIIFNTNISASAAGIAAFAHAQLYQSRRNTVEKTLGGAIGGLVAITACANMVTPISALAIGAVAGLVHNVTYELVIHRWRLDDVVGAIPAHGFCGAWGILCVAIFGNSAALPHDMVTQLGIQAVGIAACVAWGIASSWVFFRVLKMFIGLRVDPMREIRGLSLSAHEDDQDDLDEELDALFDNDTSDSIAG